MNLNGCMASNSQVLVAMTNHRCTVMQEKLVFFCKPEEMPCVLCIRIH